MSQRLRRGALSLVALAAVSGSAASSASAADFPMLCKYPLIGTVPVQVKVSGEVSRFAYGGGDLPAVPLTVSLDLPAGLETLQIPYGQARTASGAFTLKVSVLTGEAWDALNLPGTFEPTDVPDGSVSDYAVSGQATLPARTIKGTDSSIYFVTGISANLRIDKAGGAVKYPAPTTDIDGRPAVDSDGDPNTFDVSCKTTAPPRLRPLGSINGQPCPPSFFRPAPPIEEPLTDEDVSSTSVRLHWKPSPYTSKSCTPPVESYQVTYGDKTVTLPFDATETLITGLTPGTDYTFKIDALGWYEGSGQSWITVKATTKPQAGGGQPTFEYDLAGTASLKTLTKGTLPLKGSIAASVDVSTGKFTADLALNPTQGKLTALGFLPVSAKIGFVPSGKTTGTLLDGVLKTNSKVRIKVQEVKLFGAIPLAGGNNCQTKQLSDINLKSTQAEFQPLAGGPIAGTFAISDLNGCGGLNGLVSPLTAGGGNTINLNLAPKAQGA